MTAEICTEWTEDCQHAAGTMQCIASVMCSMPLVDLCRHEFAWQPSSDTPSLLPQRRMRLQAYDYITDLPRWRLHGGRDFIFFDPHPGFALGTAAYSFREAWCQQLRDAIQLVPDSFGRSHCLKPDSMPSQLVPVPYVRYSSSRLSL